jgi:hypothetical protein
MNDFSIYILVIKIMRAKKAIKIAGPPRKSAKRAHCMSISKALKAGLGHMRAARAKRAIGIKIIKCASNIGPR